MSGREQEKIRLNPEASTQSPQTVNLSPKLESVSPVSPVEAKGAPASGGPVDSHRWLVRLLPRSYMKRGLNQNLSGNQVYYTARPLLVISKNSCSKLHCRKGFNLILFSCGITSVTRTAAGWSSQRWLSPGGRREDEEIETYPRTLDSGLFTPIPQPRILHPQP